MADEQIEIRVRVEEQWFSGPLAYLLYAAFRAGIISEARASAILAASYRIRLER